MTLEEAVEYYHSLEKFGIMPGLERIKILSEKLGSPHEKLRVIHVSGTNGKGSTCTALASILTHSGYKTGLYTSPYVIDFRERIQYNMNMISPEDLIKVTQKVKCAIEILAEENIKITEFEAVTAAAFLYFADKKCDYVVLETGLGGRFDATNIVKSPLCSIITSISLDHVKILGNTPEEIAFEKAGIIKPGCPLITGNFQTDGVLRVLTEQSEKKKSEIYITDTEDTFSILDESITGTKVSSVFGIFNIPFLGRHQLDNMSLVLKAVEIIKNTGADIKDKDVCDGISSARIPARTEILCSSPVVMLDGSHNYGSTAALNGVINKCLKGKKILAVMGMMADKDCRNSIGNLIENFSYVITVRPSNPRSMDAVALSEIVQSFGVSSSAAASPAEGVDKAFDMIKDYDVLIVCGSLYLSGDVRNLLIKYCGLASHSDIQEVK